MALSELHSHMMDGDGLCVGDKFRHMICASTRGHRVAPSDALGLSVTVRSSLFPSPALWKVKDADSSVIN